MTSLRLKFVHRFRDRHGKARHYFRRPGCKTVALPGLPGSAEFMEAYQAALAGRSAPRLEIGAARTRPGSVAAAVALYFASIAFGNLAPCTKRTRRYILERFRECHGEKSFTGLERKHVEATNRDSSSCKGRLKTRGGGRPIECIRAHRVGTRGNKAMHSLLIGPSAYPRVWQSTTTSLRGRTRASRWGLHPGQKAPEGGFRDE